MKPTPASATRRRWQRQHVNRDDTPKRAFDKKKTAQGFLKIAGLGPDGVAYQCQICAKWHIGHKREEDET